MGGILKHTNLIVIKPPPAKDTTEFVS